MKPKNPFLNSLAIFFVSVLLFGIITLMVTYSTPEAVLSPNFEVVMLGIGGGVGIVGIMGYLMYHY
jgi:hypothetical protein